jgi:hypothetical protein
MEVKLDDKRSGRAVNDVDCVGCYEVLVTLCGSWRAVNDVDCVGCYEVLVTVGAALIVNSLCIPWVRRGDLEYDSFRYFGIRWRWVIGFTRRLFYPRHLWTEGQGGPVSCDGPFGERENVSPHPGIDLIFGLTPFGWLLFITLTHYFWWEYHFCLTPFLLTPTFFKESSWA